MITAFKYRLVPNKTQEAAMLRTLTTCRYLYNDALGQRIEKYTTEKKSLSYADQCNWLTENKNEYRVQVHSQVLQDVLKRLDKSFRRFFDGLKSKRKVGFPRFKAENRFRSFCYPQSGFKLLDNGRIRLSKIGDVKLRLSRPVEGNIKTCAIVRDVDQWYVVLTCEKDAVCKPSIEKTSVGVDVGLTTFATMSDGLTIENPRILLKMQKKLAKAQRRLAKKKDKTTNRRKKQKTVVAKVYRKIRRQRDDFLHKASRLLVNKYGTIVFEDLNILGMMKNHCLAKHIGDASWNKFIQFVTYKAESASSVVKMVDPRNTSQLCSGCGEKVPKTLADRIHCCPSCGLVMDRDENAALNIKQRGDDAIFNACTVGSTGKYAQGDSIRLNDLAKATIIQQPSLN